MKISVITPSIRPQGLGLVKKALRQQTFREFEWLVNSERYQGGYTGLNRAYNALIKQAKGELIVTWQDYTYAKSDCLEKFWKHYRDEPKTIIGAVGDKYADDSWTVVVWQDPRERSDQGSYYSVYFPDIEWNLASMPKEALDEVGGFDEELDMLGFGMDGYGVLNRLYVKGGWDFKLDQTQKSFALVHDRPEGWDENNLINGGYEQRRQELIDKGEWPVLKWLQKDVKSSKTIARLS